MIRQFKKLIATIAVTLSLTGLVTAIQEEKSQFIREKPFMDLRAENKILGNLHEIEKDLHNQATVEKLDYYLNWLRKLKDYLFTDDLHPRFNFTNLRPEDLYEYITHFINRIKFALINYEIKVADVNFLHQEYQAIWQPKDIYEIQL